MHRATVRFWKLFALLPEPAQRTARKNFELLKENPSHPSLHFKKVGDFWSVEAGLSYRALGVEDGADFIWLWIGSHDEYERLINRQRKGNTYSGPPGPPPRVRWVNFFGHFCGEQTNLAAESRENLY